MLTKHPPLHTATNTIKSNVKKNSKKQEIQESTKNSENKNSSVPPVAGSSVPPVAGSSVPPVAGSYGASAAPSPQSLVSPPQSGSVLVAQPTTWALGSMSLDHSQPYNDSQDGPDPADGGEILLDDADYPSFRLDRPLGEASWRIGFYNLTSLHDAERQDALLSMLPALDLDLLAIGETWLGSTGYKHLGRSLRPYGYILRHCCHGHDTLPAQRGRGVAILIREHLSRYIQEVRVVPGRLVGLTLSFRGGRRVDVIAFQAPTNPLGTGQTETAFLCGILRSWLIAANHQGRHVLLLGDLNASPSPAMDRFRPNPDTAVAISESPVIDLLHRHHLFDVWRRIHPTTIAYSHRVNTAAGVSQARLDSIWASSEWSRHLIGACISSDDWVPGSHHLPVLAEFATLDIVTPPPPCVQPSRRILDFRTLEDAHWMSFQLALSTLPVQPDPLVHDQATIDSMWGNLVSHLRRAAHENLPWRLVGRGPSTPRPSRERCNQRIAGRLRKRLTVVDQLLLDEDIRNLSRIGVSSPTTRRLTVETIHEIDAKYAELTALAKAISSARRNQAINDALERRCQSLLHSPGQLLDSLLDRSRHRGGINMVRSGDDLLLAPAEVKARVHSYFASWFSQPEGPLPLMDPTWEPFFSPLPHVEPTWYNGLLSDITGLESLHTASLLGKRKSGGPSELPGELLAHAPLPFHEALARLFTIILRSGLIPSDWREAVIFPIPKTSEFQGNLDQLRPITLIDVGRKLFSSILTRRLTDIISSRPILRGDNFGFSRGVSAQHAVHVFQMVTEDAVRTRSNLETVAVDIRRAYDSVPYDALERAMHRICLPPSYIALLLSIARDRSVRVLTSFGFTDPFRPERGIEQGEINAPLLWKIFFDPLLHRLNVENLGYTITPTINPGLFPRDLMSWEAPRPLPGRPQLVSPELVPTPTSVTVNQVTYADDMTLISTNLSDMQSQLHLLSQFLTLHWMEPAAGKCIHARRSNSPLESPLMIADSPITSIIGPSTPFRLLGVHVSLDCRANGTLNLLLAKVSSFVGILADKAITVPMALYAINHVLLPQLAYPTFGMKLTPKDLARIDTPIRAFVKRKAGLPSYIETSVLYSPEGLGLRSLADLVVEQELGEAVTLLNSPGLIGDITRLSVLAVGQAKKIPGSCLARPHLLATSHAARHCKITYWAKLLDERRMIIKSHDPLFMVNAGAEAQDSMIADHLTMPLFNRISGYLAQHCLVFAGQLNDPAHPEHLSPWPYHRRPTQKTTQPKWYSAIEAVMAPHGRQLITFSPSLYSINSRPALTHPPAHAIAESAPAGLPVTTAPASMPLTWFTDGSLEISANSRRASCSAWCAESGQQVLVKLRDTKSSTGSEIHGILEAVVRTPLDAPLTICSDSQAALALASTYRCSGTTRQRLRRPVIHALETLHACLRARTAPTNLQWVRGHSGVLGNEIADALCQRAHLEGQAPTPPVVTEVTRHALLFRGLPTTGHPRWVVKKQSQALRQAELRQASQLRRACPPNGSIAFATGLLRPSRVHSYAGSTRFSFRAKLVTGTLPTMERQGTWFPATYANTMCRRCHAAPETVEHLFACSNAQVVVASLPSTLSARLATAGLDLDPVDLALVSNRLAPFLDYHSLKGFGDTRWEAALLASGFNHVRKLLLSLVECLATIAFDLVWLPRCDATIAWERAHAIFRRHKLRPPCSGHTQPSHLSPLPALLRVDFSSIQLGVAMA